MSSKRVLTKEFSLLRVSTTALQHQAFSTRDKTPAPSFSTRETTGYFAHFFKRLVHLTFWCVQRYKEPSSQIQATAKQSFSESVEGWPVLVFAESARRLTNVVNQLLQLTTRNLHLANSCPVPSGSHRLKSSPMRWNHLTARQLDTKQAWESTEWQMRNITSQMCKQGCGFRSCLAPCYSCQQDLCWPSRSPSLKEVSTGARQVYISSRLKTNMLGQIRSVSSVRQTRVCRKRLSLSYSRACKLPLLYRLLAIFYKKT